MGFTIIYSKCQLPYYFPILKSLLLNKHRILPCNCQIASYYLFNIKMFVVTLVFLSGVVGLLWAFYNYRKLSQIDCKLPQAREEEEKKLLDTFDPISIGAIIEEGASAFILAEYKIMAIFIVIMGAIVYLCVDGMEDFTTTIAFAIGAVTSMFCGAFGMKVATYSNYRTTLEAQHSLGRGFKTAYRAGCVIGFTLVAISSMVLMIIILFYKDSFDLDDSSKVENYYEEMFEAIAGYGLGGSTIALFARVGGGIYTKAADLGSDLVGKVESGLPEDSPRNPATIADNVGDNVGDVAGMSADLFGSFAESTCAALVIGSNSIETLNGELDLDQIIFVLGIPAIGILACIIVSYLITDRPQIEQGPQVEGQLKKQLIFSTILILPCLYVIAKSAFPKPFIYIANDKTPHNKHSSDIFGCIAIGLVAGLIIGYITEVMTSYSYRYVKELAEVCKTGTATNVIYGLALGYLSTIIPIIVLCIVVYYSHSTLGYLGVALSALGMLSNLPICLAIDSYGPISDNAGGIAEMSLLPPEVRERTDILDSAGNTTAAVGKGFAIGSATLVGFALYGAFMHTCFMIGSLKQGELSFDDPLIFTSLLFGAMVPYAFSALTMKSVGEAAHGMIEQVRLQIREHPGILDATEKPNYKRCVEISTQSSLKEMIMPGLLVTVTPFLLGLFFGPKALLGFLPGAIVSGVQMAISSSNTGGAWDNAKKYIEAGFLKDQEQQSIQKGTEVHAAAVIGDTVGDPLKDTSGPSLNILIKLMAILSLVFCKYFAGDDVAPIEG